MCGIIITRDQSQVEFLKHRGIESYSVSRFGYTIGHHRLPIQTVKGDNMAQPINLKNGSLLLYNGEIFNVPEGYNSDTEYLKEIFESISVEEVLEVSNLWDGFWSIVFISPNGMMYCFTDPLGKKQLYYNEKGEICSEIWPLVESYHKFDEQYKSSVYKWGYTTSDRTPWGTIKRLHPNRLYIFCSGNLFRVGESEYFDWKTPPIIKDLEESIYKSVESRLISKSYKVGCLVSGGLDSSIIARVLHDLKAEVEYFTIENGETQYVETLADFLGFKYSKLEYDMGTDFKGALNWNETPVDLGSVVPQHKLFGAIPSTIVLSGDGADELFGGYRRINKYDSQKSDVFEELPYYHLPRLDRASMRYTKELRSPFLSHDVIKHALALPYEKRKNKKILNQMFKTKLPDTIINRKKLALKNPSLVEDPEGYKDLVFKTFYNKLF